jgi:hypothetical protein
MSLKIMELLITLRLQKLPNWQTRMKKIPAKDHFVGSSPEKLSLPTCGIIFVEG